MIDLLESRRLFTAVTAAEAVLAADAVTVRSDLTAVIAAARAEVKTVAVDLKALPRTAANRRLFKTTVADEVAVGRLLAGGSKKILGTESGNLKKIKADALAVFKHPTNVAAENRLKALLSTVSAGVQAPLTSLGLSVYFGVQKVTADFSAIEVANPTDTKLPADVTADGAVVTTALTKLETDAGQFQTDLTALSTALGG